MSERALSKIQFGKESTPGTAVAADTLLLGAEIGPIPVDRVPSYPEDNLGVRARSSRSVFYNYLVENTLSIPEGYFDILPMIFSLGLKGGVSASEQNGGEGDYLWDFTPSLTASNSPDAITLEAGDNTQAYEIEHVMFARIKLTGVVAQNTDESPVSIEVDYFGRQVTPTSFTGAITAPSVETMHGGLSRVYVDSAWADRGTSEVTGILRGWELEIITGLHPKFYGSANRYFDEEGEGFIDAMLTLTYEGNSKADTEFDTFQAGSKQAVQIQVNGTQIGAGDNRNLTLSLFGSYENVIPLGDESQGNNLHTALFHGLYDPTGAAELEVKTTVDANAF